MTDFSATRYDIDTQIGRGGMGIVFRARDRELAREVAVKVTSWPGDAEAERLRAEARVLATLEHPGIVPVHDVGRLPDGRAFYVMHLVRGERLDVHAARMALADRLRLFDRVCDTVAFAHARGFVHRDLKPANIMVGAFGDVRVLDWGLARPAAGLETARVTSTNRPPHDVSVASLPTGAARALTHIAGTEGFMAPEQARGVADARSDLYALGAILSTLVAPEGRARALRPLHSIVARAMAEDPASRYADVAALAADVRRFVDGHAVDAYRESLVDRTARLVKAYRTPIALILAYLAMRILLLLWARWSA